MDGSNPKHVSALFGPTVTASGVCEKHGAWSRELPEFLAAKASCADCGAEAIQAKHEKLERDRQQAAAARRVADLEKRGVGLRHLDKTFDTFVADNKEQRIALDACRSLTDAVLANKTRIPSLILSGGPGTGKTHLTCAMIQRLYDAGSDATKSNVLEIVRDIKATWRKGSEDDEDDVIRWYASRDLLVIDEIGVQFGSDTERMFVFDIINRRYEGCRPTVLITNLDLDGLRAEIGERVLDRLREDGGRMLSFTGKSWRGQ